MVECVVNVSEGRDEKVLAELAAAAGTALLDLHCDPHHHRSVLTLAGSPDDVASAARSLAVVTVERLDLSQHAGVHPRLGVLDVVPFVPYELGASPPRDLAGSVVLRDAFARWLGTELGVPCFLYGPHVFNVVGDGWRSLPEVRRRAFTETTPGDGEVGLHPDFGPALPDPRVGATAVGSRRVLVAYNVWVSPAEVAGKVAPQVRQPSVRALGLAVGERAQVSCNLLDPVAVGPAAVYDQVASLVGAAGGSAEGGELVGLLPEVVLAAVPRHRWAELGLAEGATVEARLGQSR